MTGGKLPLNRLRSARLRRNISQKFLAYLLHHQTIDQVSRYEKGSRLPSLKTAMKLELILGTPLKALFDVLASQARKEILDRLDIKHRHLVPVTHEPSEYCAFDELLKGPNVSDEVRKSIHRHAASLINKMNLMDSSVGRESV